MRTPTRKQVAMAAVLTVPVLALLLTPLPLPLRSTDEEYVVRHVVRTLLSNRRVLTALDKGPTRWRRLADQDGVKTSGGLFFVNELGIPDDVFLELGLMPVPGNRRLDVDAGDTLVRFSHRDPYGNPSAAVHLSYVYGSLGAQGYEMRVRRSLLRRYLVYVWRWCS